MLENLRTRFILLCIMLAAVFVALSSQLAVLTLAQSDEYNVKSEKVKVSTDEIRGQRGRIYDSKSQLLAFNETSFDVQFLRTDQDTLTTEYHPMYTEIIEKTIEIIERNGGKIEDTFSIRKLVDGTFEFFWGPGIGSEAAAKREKKWRENMGANKDSSPEDIYNELRKRYYIPEDMPYLQARKLLSIWQEVRLSKYMAYVPVTVAYNVSMETVAEIETHSNELKGMSTRQSTKRVYPKGSLVSHIVGYIGRIDDFDDYKAKGYATDSLVGKEGLEKSQEGVLTGNTTEHQGKQVREITRAGQVVRVLDSSPPTDGNDIYTTIDLELQQVASEALQRNIEEIRAAQEEALIENAEEYRKKRSDLSTIAKAEVGTVVVLEAKTGNTLALVNYPSFDNNDFVGGISAEDFQVLNEDPRLPMFNRAIMYKTMPGSIFKMATGLAGLQEGVITVDELISDEGPYIKVFEDQEKAKNTAGAPKCWTSYPDKHADQNIVKALMNSCNYYFFEVAYRTKIDLLNKWCHNLGLDLPTNIELPGEAVGQIGGQEVLYDYTKPVNEQKASIARLVKSSIVSLLSSYCNQLGISTDPQDKTLLPAEMPEEEKQARTKEMFDNAVSRCAERLMQLVTSSEKKQLGNDIRRIMREELGIPQGISAGKNWSAQISSMLTELQWNMSQTVRTGIGQAVVQLTPIAAARYVAAIVNGGHVYDAHIIDRIIDPDGNTIKEVKPTLVNDLNAKPLYLSKIKEGMKSVVSEEDGGTAGTAFHGFEYNDQIGGKTGTAQIKLSSNNIDLENTSWMVGFAPFDDPEIVVVVCIPNGWSGSRSATTFKSIVKFYMDRKTDDAMKTSPEVNGLTQ